SSLKARSLSFKCHIDRIRRTMAKRDIATSLTCQTISQERLRKLYCGFGRRNGTRPLRGSMVPKAHKEYTGHSATMLRCGERSDLNPWAIMEEKDKGKGDGCEEEVDHTSIRRQALRLAMNRDFHLEFDTISCDAHSTI